jgi:hypothetical protein
MRGRGTILVLVIDETQMHDDHAALARVVHEYDVATLDELATDLNAAAEQAANQARLSTALVRVLARRRAGRSPLSAATGRKSR